MNTLETSVLLIRELQETGYAKLCKSWMPATAVGGPNVV